MRWVLTGLVVLAGWSLGAGQSQATVSPLRGLAQSFHTHLIRAGQRPEPVFADPAHHRVYIGYEHSGYVVAVDDRTDGVLKTIRTGKEVEDLAYDQSANRLYVANRTSNSVSVIDTVALRRVGSIQVPPPADLAIDHALSRLYIASAHQIATVDTATGRVVTSTAQSGSPQAAAVDPGTHHLFIALQKRNRLLMLDGESLRVLARITVGEGSVHPMRLDSTRHRLYVVNAASSTLSVLDTRSLQVVRTLRLGLHPEGLWIEPQTQHAFVSNEGDPGTDKNYGHTVSVLDLRSGRVIATLPTLLGPDGVAYDRAVGKIYASNENSGNVSAITVCPRVLSICARGGSRGRSTPKRPSN